MTIEYEKVNGMYWKCNLPAFLSEVLNNNAALHPLTGCFKVLGCIFDDLAKTAIEIDDPRLNLMMCRLSLFAEADQYSEDFNPDIFKILEEQVKELREKEEDKR